MSSLHLLVSSKHPDALHRNRIGLITRGRFESEAGHLDAAQHRTLGAHIPDIELNRLAVFHDDSDKGPNPAQTIGFITTRAEASVASTDSATPAPITRP